MVEKECTVKRDSKVTAAFAMVKSLALGLKFSILYTNRDCQDACFGHHKNISKAEDYLTIAVTSAFGDVTLNEECKSSDEKLVAFEA